MAYISLDDTVARCAERAHAPASADRKWSARRSLALVVSVSLLLWALILAPFFLF